MPHHITSMVRNIKNSCFFIFFLFCTASLLILFLFILPKPFFSITFNFLKFLSFPSFSFFAYNLSLLRLSKVAINESMNYNRMLVSACGCPPFVRISWSYDYSGRYWIETDQGYSRKNKQKYILRMDNHLLDKNFRQGRRKIHSNKKRHPNGLYFCGENVQIEEPEMFKIYPHL